MSSGFEILTNPAGGGNLKWIPRGAGIYANAVPGGRTADAKILYIARCLYNGIYIPGYVAANNPGVMKYTYAGVELQCSSNYEFLVCE